MSENFKRIESLYSNENKIAKEEDKNFFGDSDLNVNRVIADVLTPGTQQSQHYESKIMNRPSDLDSKSGSKAKESASQVSANPVRNEAQDMLEAKSLRN